MTEREQQIRSMLVGGASLGAIGKAFSLSKQRIHQIASNRRRLKDWHRERQQANLELISRYSPIPACQRCRKLLDLNGVQHYARFCDDCDRKIRLVLEAQALIRNKGKIRIVRGYACYHSLNNAAHLIRKHNLKPDDFR